MKHFLVQPEYRKWLNEAFTGSFIGLQVHYALYNFGGMLPWGFGNGKMLGIENRQNAHLNYKRYGQPAGAPLIEKSNCNYWGPTQIGISVVYFIQ